MNKCFILFFDCSLATRQEQKNRQIVAYNINYNLHNKLI